MGAFQVRLPDDLHTRLNDRAKALGAGASMNKLVEEAVRNLLDGGEINISSDTGATDAREDLVVASLAGGVGALKGIAQHYGNLGLANLSGLLYGLSAEVLATTDPKLASKELTKTASRLLRARRELALGLLHAALRHNPQNEMAQNLLGQALYFSGQESIRRGDTEAGLLDFKEAVLQLSSVQKVDNRARLFHGRASLALALDADNRTAVRDARDQIVVALKQWAFGSQDNRERSTWLRQVGELDRLGSDFQQTVDELLDYANDNTSWAQVSHGDLSTTSPTSLADELGGLGESVPAV